MLRTMLKAKIHRAWVTGAELYYEGSIAIDQDLLDAVDILPGEQVQVLNMNTGARLITYAIHAESGSGTMMLNGPAARLGEIGDEISVLAYAQMDDDEARTFKPKKIRVDKENRLARVL